LEESVFSEVSASPSSTNSIQESVTSVVQRFSSNDFLDTNSLAETTRAALGVGNTDTSTLQESVTFVVLRADNRGDNNDDDDSSVPPGVPGTDEEIISTPSHEPALALEPLGENLVRLWHLDNTTKKWSFYDQCKRTGSGLSKTRSSS
jgi:hypothetical protein